MPSAMTVYHVPGDAPAKAEAMGTKPKFWFSRDDAMWLFKSTRPGQGEHWAEVVAASLAEMLGLPHAHYELARWREDAVQVLLGRLPASEVSGPARAFAQAILSANRRRILAAR